MNFGIPSVSLLVISTASSVARLSVPFTFLLCFSMICEDFLYLLGTGPFLVLIFASNPPQSVNWLLTMSLVFDYQDFLTPKIHDLCFLRLVKEIGLHPWVTVIAFSLNLRVLPFTPWPLTYLETLLVMVKGSPW